MTAATIREEDLKGWEKLEEAYKTRRPVLVIMSTSSARTMKTMIIKGVDEITHGDEIRLLVRAFDARTRRNVKRFYADKVLKVRVLSRKECAALSDGGRI